MRKLPGQPGGALLATGEARRVRIGGGWVIVVGWVVRVSSVVFGIFCWILIVLIESFGVGYVNVVYMQDYNFS